MCPCKCLAAPYLGQVNVRLLGINAEHISYKRESQWSWRKVGWIPISEETSYQEKDKYKQQYSLEVEPQQNTIEPHGEGEQENNSERLMRDGVCHTVLVSVEVVLC